MRIIKLSIFILLLVSISCSKKEANTTITQEDDLSELSSSADLKEVDNAIIVSIKLLSSSFCVNNEDENEIIIEPCAPYYKEWVSTKRIMLTDMFDKFDDLKFPVLDVYVVNNTDQSLVINSLDFIVKESKIDSIPYLYIYNNYASSSDEPNTILMSNESWFNWGNMYLDYSIMKRGESFNGTYKKRKTIPYFEYTTVDFTQDLVDMGLNMENIYEISYGIQQTKCLDELSDDKDEILSMLSPFEADDEAGFARIYGKISFSKSNFTKQFYGIIYITRTLGGAADVPADKFNVSLSYDKRDYTISYPYMTTIKPGDNEKVRLSVNCPRSSNHNFYISINNDNGLVMRTKDVKMHYLNGRHSALQPRE